MNDKKVQISVFFWTFYTTFLLENQIRLLFNDFLYDIPSEMILVENDGNINFDQLFCFFLIVLNTFD
jgi:hypothetical protein